MIEHIVFDAVHGMKVKSIELPVQKCKGRNETWWCDTYVLVLPGCIPQFCMDCQERSCKECFWVGGHQRKCPRWESGQ